LLTGYGQELGGLPCPGIRADGRKEMLGLWIERTEGGKFWLKVFNELRNRGVEDMLLAIVDGLRGFPEAIEAVYPQAHIQPCIVHWRV
jgi:putative transposase